MRKTAIASQELRYVVCASVSRKIEKMKAGISMSVLLILLFGNSFLFSQELEGANSANLVESVLYEYYETISEQNRNCQDEISEFLGHLLIKPKTPSVESLTRKLLMIRNGCEELFLKSDINLFEEELISERYSLDSFYLFCQDCYNLRSKYNSLLTDKVIDSDEDQFIYDSEKLKELAFYKIRPKDAIAEIGSGNGCNTEILSMVYPENQIYANELNPQQVEILQRQLGKSSNVKIIKGESTSCGLEDMGIEVLIARNSFHHFEKKIEMVDSIIDSMNKEGRFIVLERFVDYNEAHCELAVGREYLVNFMKARGLILTRHQMIYGTSELMEFKFSD